MTVADPLPPERLHTPCDPAALGFQSSDALPDLDAADIHARAVDAIRLGLDIGGEGYNLFVLGDAGSGRHEIVTRLLEDERHEGPPPADWCYVWNFDTPSHPRLLTLPCGRGPGLRDDMQRFVEELMPAIAAVFESDEYRNRIEALQDEAKQREETALRQLGDEAQTLGIALLRTPHGFAFLPMKDADSTLSQEEFEKLPEERQHALSEHIKTLHERMHRLMNEFPRWRRELQNRIRDAGRDALGATVTHMIEELKLRYADLPEVCAHLDDVLRDIIASGESLHASPRNEDDGDTLTYSGSISVQRYLVNLLVANPADGTRPVVYEDHPTLQNLVGRVDHLVHMGTLVSNFTLIRAGALHRANGGFLVLDAIKLLAQPFAWEGVKRALKSGRLRIESLSELIGVAGSVQLEPEPMPLTLKLILIGQRLVYYLLGQYDPEFAALFRINADMEREIARTPDNTAAYARLIATLARRGGLPPLSAAAIARLIEHAARLAGDAERLSTQTQPIDDRLREAAHFAGAAGAPCIERVHIDAALDAHRRRHERIRLHYQQEILRG
ncbi:MAG TPA: ATP-dependent protease, partial [Thauera sp.]|nr:ATP-dependent protease [Thauera sp.]